MSYKPNVCSSTCTRSQTCLLRRSSDWWRSGLTLNRPLSTSDRPVVLLSNLLTPILITYVTKLISDKWPQFWNSCTGNKLQTIRPTVSGRQQKSSLSRQDEVVINRLRIGHIWCTHSYLLSCADQPECTTYQCPLTVKHILVECTDFNDTRTKYFVTSSLKELFRTVDILDFVKERAHSYAKHLQ